MQWGALKYMCQYLHLAMRKKRGGKYDFGWTRLWWITDVHFNLFTSFWFSSLSSLLQSSDHWRWLTDQDCWGKMIAIPLLIYFFSPRCNAMPKRKLRFQAVQSEYQMRCNSMENIKCQSQFCAGREGFSTLRWLASARAALRYLSSFLVRFSYVFWWRRTSSQLYLVADYHSFYL